MSSLYNIIATLGHSHYSYTLVTSHDVAIKSPMATYIGVGTGGALGACAPPIFWVANSTCAPPMSDLRISFSVTEWENLVGAPPI